MGSPFDDAIDVLKGAALTPMVEDSSSSSRRYRTPPRHRDSPGGAAAGF